MRSTALLLVCVGLVGVSGLVGCAGTSEDGAGASTEAVSNDEVKSDKVLLDCNVFLSGGGPDQQVTVIQRGEGLVLRELTIHGSVEERALTAEEWESKNLKLRLDKWDLPDADNRLYFERGAWMNISKSDGWLAQGGADCSNTNR